MKTTNSRRIRFWPSPACFLACIALLLLAGSPKLHGQDYRDWLARAEQADAKGDNQMAIECLTQAIKGCPENSFIYSNRAAHFIVEGRFDEALSDLDAALKINPQSWPALYNRGCLYAKQKKFPEALKDADSAIRDSENAYERPYILRGRVRFDLGDYTAALSDLHEATVINWQSADASDTLAWILAACPDSHIRNGSEAVKYAKRACEINKWAKPGMLDTLAAAYAESGDFADAVRTEMKCLALTSPSSKATSFFQTRLILYQSHKPYRSPDFQDGD